MNSGRTGKTAHVARRSARSPRVVYILRSCVNETAFRLTVALVAVALIAGGARVRFGETPGLPPRPTSQPAAVASAEALLSTSLASPAVWKNFLESDAKAAKVAVPSAAEMGKKLIYRSDLVRHELSFAEPKLETAGLSITLERDRDAALLVINNTTERDVAYRVQSTPSLPASVCNAVTALGTNALVVLKGGSQRRTICAFRSDLTLLISRVETVELPPLSSWYLQQVSPIALGLEPKLARVHRPDVRSNCSPIVPQSVRSGLESGDLGWRDLVDFYARHRCETYQFPHTYRAFTRDDERPLPAVPPPDR